MLIVYDLATGEVFDNTGVNNALPLGPSDESAYVNTDARGIARDGLALLRLHDDTDADLVQQVLRNRHHVDTSGGEPTVVVDGPYPVEELTADPTTIPADGATASTVTYRNTHADAPAEVTYDVNGAAGSVPLAADGTAVLEVTAATAGPVRVRVSTLETVITAGEV